MVEDELHCCPQVVKELLEELAHHIVLLSCLARASIFASQIDHVALMRGLLIID